MTHDSSNSEIETWVDRARRMVDYREEATDFLRRASSMLPVVESDVELVCRLWTAADEYDVSICDALRRFDQALFDVPGQLDITRGAEPTSTRDDGEGLAYLCSWTLMRPEADGMSVALMADQLTGRFSFEVRDSNGDARTVAFPIGCPSELYEALTHGFFRLQMLKTTE